MGVIIIIGTLLCYSKEGLLKMTNDQGGKIALHKKIGKIPLAKKLTVPTQIPHIPVNVSINEESIKKYREIVIEKFKDIHGTYSKCSHYHAMTRNIFAGFSLTFPILMASLLSHKNYPINV